MPFGGAVCPVDQPYERRLRSGVRSSRSCNVCAAQALLLNRDRLVKGAPEVLFMRKSTWVLFSSLLAVLLLAAAACGGGDKGSDDGVSNQDGTESSSDGGSHSSSGGGALTELLVSNPGEALGQSAEAFSEQVDSMQGTFLFAISGGGLDADISGDFAYRSPDSVYMTMNMSASGDDALAVLGDMNFDVLMLGDKLYMNTPFFGGWVVMSMDEIGVDAEQYKKLLADHAPFDYSALMEGLDGVAVVGDEKIDGQTYLHLQLETDFATAMAAIADSFQTTGFDASTLPTDALSGPLVLDLWVNPDNGLPRRLSASGSMELPDDGTGTSPGGAMEFKMGFEFEKYNENVDIPDAPKDAKSFVDLFSDGGGLFGDDSGD